MANVYVCPPYILHLLSLLLSKILTPSLMSLSTARRQAESHSSSMMTSSLVLQGTSESLPQARTALATRAPVSTVSFLRSCCREAISPGATVLGASPFTARSSRVGIPYILVYLLTYILLRRELHTEAHQGRPALHGQRWPKHQRLSVLHHDSEDVLAGWKACRFR